MAKKNYYTGLLSKTKPVTIEKLNNGQGTVHYNHNIKEILVIEGEDGSVEITEDKEKATGTMFQYDCVRVEYPTTADNIFGTLLNAKYDSDHQDKLNNEYQSACMGLLDKSFKVPYEEFLKDRLAIRAMVDKDAEENNLPID